MLQSNTYHSCLIIYHTQATQVEDTECINGICTNQEAIMANVIENIKIQLLNHKNKE